MSSTDGERRAQERSERERRFGNFFLVIAAAVLVMAGIWLVDALLAARKADECISAGRRNCSPLDAPTGRR